MFYIKYNRDCCICSHNRSDFLIKDFAFRFSFYLVLINSGSRRKNMTTKTSSFVRGRRNRRFKNDDFQINPSISRDSFIFRNSLRLWLCIQYTCKSDLQNFATQKTFHLKVGCQNRFCITDAKSGNGIYSSLQSYMIYSLVGITPSFQSYDCQRIGLVTVEVYINLHSTFKMLHFPSFFRDKSKSTEFRLKYSVSRLLERF